MSATVQIVLPGLFDLPLHELEPELLQQDLPCLNRILRLASPQPNQAYTIDAMLEKALAVYGYQQEAQAGLPLAQACAGIDVAEYSRLLLCQAVHLRADMHNAIIVPLDDNEINREHIGTIINDLNELFNVDYNFNVIADNLFLVHLKAFDAPTCYPHVLSVLGKTANPYIEQSRQVLPWYKLLNEIQMFMHQHEVNQQRIQQGLLPINSLWFWGAGNRPRIPEVKPAWYCDDPLLNRFAQSLGLEPRCCAELEGTPGAEDALVIDMRLLELLKTGLAVPVDQLLLDIDRRLLRPLLNSFDRGQLQIMLHAGYELDFKLKSLHRLRLWRRSRNLGSWSNARDEYR